MKLRTCVDPSGKFVYGMHTPTYNVGNLRTNDSCSPLGEFENGIAVDNRQNFPVGNVTVPKADPVFEIPNAFPFQGATYINKSWADRSAADPGRITQPPLPETSFARTLKKILKKEAAADSALDEAISLLPDTLLLSLAATSTDPEDLICLARHCCEFVFQGNGRPAGLKYTTNNTGRRRPIIRNHDVFEVVVNNPFLPDDYKEVMVLRPGAQGTSEIVGEFTNGETHVFEYLRSNSYIPWGHYASNMAHDAIRYHTRNLSETDILGLRHLFYQRTFTRMAEKLHLPLPQGRKQLTIEELETIRQAVVQEITLKKTTADQPDFNATLWGWNFGFDFSPSGYRLHASHQQIHQQFALLPAMVSAWHDSETPAEKSISTYGCGDLVADFIETYKRESGQDFFASYIKAIRTNRRMDKATEVQSLIVYEDDQVMLFVPKAQTSQWEMQIMTVEPVGNILEADTACRRSLDLAILTAQRIYAALGARIVTTIEYTKRFDAGNTGQRLLYAFLPKLPWSMGAFSEAQLRYISGHYPEDFAAACREKLAQTGTSRQ